MGKTNVKTNMGRTEMIQNFNDEQLDELEEQQEADVLDDEYWYNFWQSQKEEEAIEEYYNKKHNET